MVITSSLAGQVLASLLAMKQDQILCNVYENPFHFEQQHKKKLH